MPYCPNTLKTEAFIAGFDELFSELKHNPELRIVALEKLDAIRNGLYNLGYTFRIRYRGPHGISRDTLKRNARAFTVYIQNDKDN